MSWVFAPAGNACVAVTMTAARQIPAHRAPTHPRLLTRLPRRGFPAASSPRWVIASAFARATSRDGRLTESRHTHDWYIACLDLTRMLLQMTLQSFVASADLAIAISIAALSVSALRSGRRPHRMRSWLFFALGSMTLVVHSAFGTLGAGQAETADLFELLTLALFATGFVLLYGADREQLRSIETRAELDATTGLLNRQAFRDLVGAHLRRPRAPLRKAVRQGPASRGGARLRSRAPWPGDQRPELARRYLGTVQIALHDLHPERRECLLLFDRFDGIRDDARAGLLRLVDDGDDRLRVRDVVA